MQILFELSNEINSKFNLNLKPCDNENEIQQRLSKYINNMLNYEMQKLIFLLYRIDIDEEKLKQALNINKEINSAEIIAKLIIERMKQKIKSKDWYKQNKNSKEDW